MSSGGVCPAQLYFIAGLPERTGAGSDTMVPAPQRLHVWISVTSSAAMLMIHPCLQPAEGYYFPLTVIAASVVQSDDDTGAVMFSIVALLCVDTFVVLTGVLLGCADVLARSQRCFISDVTSPCLFSSVWHSKGMAVAGAAPLLPDYIKSFSMGVDLYQIKLMLFCQCVRPEYLHEAGLAYYWRYVCCVGY